MNSGNFFAELKRRNVYKVAVAYIVAGWALSQATVPARSRPCNNWLLRRATLLITLSLWFTSASATRVKPWIGSRNRSPNVSPT